MKWVFIAGLLVFIPVLAAALRSNAKNARYAAFFLGALPFFLVPHLYVAPVSWAAWPGPVKGIEVSTLDGFAIAILLSTRKSRIPSSLKLSVGVIALALIASTSTGFQAVPALFYAWQLFRVVIVFLAVTRLCATIPDGPVVILAGAGLGLIFEALLAAYQYAGGDPRPGGNLGHSNFLGLASDFVVFPALALLLGGKRFWTAIVVLAGLVIAVLGGSRATLGLFGIGSVLTVILSLRHGRTTRKVAFASVLGLAMLLAAPVIIWAADRRSEADKISSDQDRALMKEAAAMMIADHPLGVGADQYVIIANTAGYSARAGVPWDASDRSAPVHDFYYLLTAELGFLGLFGFLALIANLIVIAFRALRRSAGDQASELIPGLAAMMLIVVVHISFEWVFMQFVTQYLFAIAAGSLVAIASRSNASLRCARPTSIAQIAVAPRQ